RHPAPDAGRGTGGGRDGTLPAPAAPGPTGERAGPAAADVSGPGPEQSVPTQGTEPHPAPGAGTGTAGGTDGTLHAPAVPGPAGEPSGPAAARVPPEGPRPQHDPDPHPTPPYGEPGPWAPAPPGHPPSDPTA